jgi:hypothetical protein
LYRGFRRIVLTLSVLLSAGAAIWALWDGPEAFREEVASVDPPGGITRPGQSAALLVETRLKTATIAFRLSVIAGAAIAPWMLYWITRWILRGFTEDAPS